jgi:hypothetical protein
MMNPKPRSNTSFMLYLAVLILTLSSCANNSSVEEPFASSTDVQYVPLWMQPNTVIVYDDSLKYTVVSGGELTEEEISGREDILTIGLTTTDPEMIAEPNIKVEYDLHGFIQNIYYPVPGKTGEYQLSKPSVPNKSDDTSGQIPSIMPDENP